MLLSFLLLASALSAQEGEGYRLLFNQVRVDRPVHWRAWHAPTGVQVVRADGTVEPRFLRRVIEVARDAPDFTYVSTFASEDTLQGGIRAVGTGRDSAPLVLDGNPNTYWEPQRTSSLDRWFLEIDLGRTVIAHRVVLRFVAEGQGDPFLKFGVMASDGLRWGQGRDQRRKFFRVGLETKPNKDQREYVFDIAPDRQVPEGVEGEIVQFLRIDVLDTDGPRAEEISAGTYAFLAEEDRG
ncbi:MAG: discoidin domain-containing protein, partial [Gemmatimonadetes bacterium]|nr:discoidin domain-containing protein [Gemmatimonadota bacterium]